MARETIRDWVRSLERAEPAEQWTILCFFAGRAVTIDGDELNAALRRAELLLAAGGDPHRPLDPFGRAATALADDLDAPERRAQLREGLESLREVVAGLLCGDVAHPADAHGVARGPLKLIARLAG